MFARRLTALAVGTAASAALLVVTAPESPATLSGSCSGGQLTMDTTPIGLSTAPVTAQVNGQVTGCNGTPTPAGRFIGDFTGNGTCLDVGGTVNARIEWDNGEVSTVSGPYRVAGGVAPPPSTNTVAITAGPGAGGTATVTQAGPDPASLTAPCLADAARNLTVGLTQISFT